MAELHPSLALLCGKYDSPRKLSHSSGCATMEKYQQKPLWLTKGGRVASAAPFTTIVQKPAIAFSLVVPSHRWFGPSSSQIFISQVFQTHSTNSGVAGEINPKLESLEQGWMHS